MPEGYLFTISEEKPGCATEAAKACILVLGGGFGASPRLARVTLVLSGVALVMPGNGTLYSNPTGSSSRSPRCWPGRPRWSAWRADAPERFAGERARSEGAARV